MKLFYLILGVILAYIVFALYYNNKFKKRLLKLSKSRNNVTKNDYIQFYVNLGYDKLLTKTSYENINNYLAIPDFNMHPEDDLYELYEIDPEDFGDLINKIFETINYDIPTYEILK